VMTGMYAAVAILAALRHRDATGEGQQIDIALVDVQTSWLINEGTNYLLSGQEPVRRGNQHPNIVPYQAFAVQDGHVIVAVGNDAQFGRFCELIGQGHLASDKRYATNAQRLLHREALIALLTGKNTDRLREEQERGISIELGYAELDLPGGSRLSVIDVPGHERLVRAMVAGATGIDLFLLVIAADDGVMPQTAEHLAIIDLLGVRHGVVALTKADVVDDELLELAKDDVSEFLADSPYARSEIVTVSARDGRGKDNLLAALERAAAEVKARRRSGPARLPVDRVFPLKGIGTVVTGTLWQGEVRAGDQLVVEPSAVRTAVRSVQSLDHEAHRLGVSRQALIKMWLAEKIELH